MKKLILGIGLISLLSAGCEKVITEVPYSFLTAENFPTTAAEADAALVSLYSPLKSNGMWNYTAGLYMNSQNDVTVENSAWGRFGSPTHGQEGAWWTASWQGINTANDIIAALEMRDAAKDVWVPQKMAEARAMRAYYYHTLASLFGDLPLRLKPTTETVLITPRSPVEDIYANVVLPDLAFADNMLPKVGNGGGRLTNAAVKCIIVDVYMKLAGWRRSSQGKMVAGDPKYWAMARDKAAEVLDMEASGMFALESEYSQVFTKLSTDVYSKEVIWDLQYTQLAGSNFPYVFGPRGVGKYMGGGNGNLRPIREFVRSWDNRDERFIWNIADYEYRVGWTRYPLLTDTNNYRVATFQKIYPSTGYWEDHLTNWPLYRLAEIKLWYAEAANEANGGPTAEAYKQLNAVRYRARPAAQKTSGAVLPDRAGLTQAQFREAIMEERKMELINEGKRRLDLIRWGVLQEKIEAIPSRLTAITSSGGFNPRFYLWSLPTADLTTNGWQNNEGF